MKFHVRINKGGLLITKILISARIYCVLYLVFKTQKTHFEEVLVNLNLTDYVNVGQVYFSQHNLNNSSPPAKTEYSTLRLA